MESLPKLKDLIKKPVGPILVGFLLILLTAVWATRIAAQTPFRFISWGDAQSSAANLPVTSKQAVTLNPAFTIFNGDLENDGFQVAQMNLMVNALNGDSDGRTSNGMFNETFLVRGNHDNHYSDPADWEDYLVRANRPPISGVANYVGMDANSTYLNYAFDYENARFIGLDVPGNVNELSAAQITWLERILSDAEANHPELQHAFIFFHGPIYCIGAVHCSCTAVNDPACIPSSVTSLISVFNRHSIVSATFHGHEHDLTWTHINSTRITGVTHEFEQFVTSPSGGDSHDSRLFPQRVDYAAMTATQGFASIDVSGTEFTVSFYKNGVASPVWSKTFSKSASSPSRLSTPLATSKATPTTSSVMTTSMQVSASSENTAEFFGNKRVRGYALIEDVIKDADRVEEVIEDADPLKDAIKHADRVEDAIEDADGALLGQIGRRIHVRLSAAINLLGWAP